jgi:protein-S-isoprenylcysteine O-methyltransferase Ste14
VAGWAIGLLVIYLALAGGVRVAVALRTTGATGVADVRRGPPAEVLGGALFITALTMGFSNPVLVAADLLDPLEDPDRSAFHALGFAFCAIGIIGTFPAQMAMGTSWWIGVDAEERTELVTGGVFSLCRNPIYTFMVLAWIGFALLVPTWLAIVAIAAAVIAFEVQVRLVEEPYLIRSHGDAYLAWASRVGRFVPGIGRLN